MTVADEKFRELQTLLVRRGLIGNEHEALLRIYCDALETWIYATTKIEGSGHLIKSPRDGVVVSPLLAIKDGAAATIDRIGRQLGLSPDHRIPALSPTWAEFVNAAV